MTAKLADVLDQALMMENALGDRLGIVEMLQALAQNTKKIALAINADVAPGPGAAGGLVACLTEAVMDSAAATVKVAESIQNLADAVTEHGNSNQEGLFDLAGAIREHTEFLKERIDPD